MRGLALFLAVAAWPALALDLTFPAPADMTADTRADGRLSLPAGPWTDAGQQTRTAQGVVRRTAWRIEAAVDTGDVTRGLSDQMRAAGYKIVYDCAADDCGGYDFRFATRTLPAPDMFVDLGDFRYLLASAPDGGLASVVVSRAGGAGYVQLTTVSQEEPDAVTVRAGAPGAVAGPIWAALERDGHAPLDDLSFATGSAALDGGPFGSLEILAQGLQERPGARIALVGHTDTRGGLEANMSLSRRRAAAVRDELSGTYGIDEDRIAARGVGYLSPRTTNDTPEGRRANRRVEVVLIR